MNEKLSDAEHAWTNKANAREKDLRKEKATLRQMGNYAISASELLDELNDEYGENLPRTTGAYWQRNCLEHELKTLCPVFADTNDAWCHDLTRHDPDAIEACKSTKNNYDRLEAFTKLSLLDRMRLLSDKTIFGDRNLDYFTDCLDDIGFYADETYDAWVGADRASRRAVMLGTPEDAVRRVYHDKYGEPIKDDLALHCGALTTWKALCDTYDIIKKNVTRTHPNADEKKIEYWAVRNTADLYREVAKFNNLPSEASFIAGRFGNEVTERRLDALAGQIDYKDYEIFDNLQRFIGKAGISKKFRSYNHESHDLAQATHHISEEDMSSANAFALKKQDEYEKRQEARINKKFDKKIARTRSAERNAIHEQERQKALRLLHENVNSKREYLENRTLEQYQQELSERMEIVLARREKHKTMIDKALDLTYMPHDANIASVSPVFCVNWLSKATFAEINKYHKMLHEKGPAETFKQAYSEIVTGEPGNFDEIERLFIEYGSKLHLEPFKLRETIKKNPQIAKTGNIRDMYQYGRRYYPDVVENWLREQEIEYLSEKEIPVDFAIFRKIRDEYLADGLDAQFELAAKLTKVCQLGDLVIKDRSPYENSEQAELLPELIRQGYSIDQIKTALYNWDHKRRAVFDKSETKPDFEKMSQVPEWVLKVCDEKDKSAIGDTINSFEIDPRAQKARHLWCEENAFVRLDGDWSKQSIGKFLYTRVETGLDDSLHDASQILERFRIRPDKTYYDVKAIKQARKENPDSMPNLEDLEMKLADPAKEMELLMQIGNAYRENPEEFKRRVNLPHKAQRIAQLFTKPSCAFLYTKLLDQIDNGESIDLYDMSNNNADSYEAFYNEYIDHKSKNSIWHINKNDFLREIFNTKSHINDIARGETSGTLGENLQLLMTLGENRKKYIDDVTDYLRRHTSSSAESISKSWGDRAVAIYNGYEDSAADIRTYSAIEGLKNTLDHRRSEITLEDLNGKYKHAVMELSRVYSNDDVLDSLEIFARNYTGEEKTMPAKVLEIGDEKRPFRGELLAGDDFRGFTIGQDTGCCMHTDGVSESCIKAGYHDKNSGFFALYDQRNRLMAQSYLYINSEHPDTVIIDNIEANSGRDNNRILDLYRDFFTEYCKEQFATNPDWKVRQVNIGTGYGEVAKPLVLRLPGTEIISNNCTWIGRYGEEQSGVYSDAKADQRLLFRFSDKEIANIRAENNIQVTELEPVIAAHPIEYSELPVTERQIPLIQDLEARIYPEEMRQYGDNSFIESELEYPESRQLSFIYQLRHDANTEPIGYCIAYEDETRDGHNSDIDNTRVAYIADFAVLPEYRDGFRTAINGLDQIISRCEAAGYNRIEMDARESTSYRLLNSSIGKRLLERRGYELTDIGPSEEFSETERTNLIVLNRIA